jgi:hypothetical protein
VRCEVSAIAEGAVNPLEPNQATRIVLLPPVPHLPPRTTGGVFNGAAVTRNRRQPRICFVTFCSGPVDNEDNPLTTADAVHPITISVSTGAAMRKIQIVPHLRIMNRPSCENCDTPMWLVSIEPDDKSDHDRRTFECPRCQHEWVEVVKYR